MTLLTAVQDAALRTIGRAKASVTAVVASTDKAVLELADLANESARAIVEAHDWRVLTTLHTITGDGTDTSFPLPSDYARLPSNVSLFSTLTHLPLVPARDLDAWLDFQIRPLSPNPGYWLLLGGSMNILPAPPSNALIKFYYITNKVVTAADTTTKATFTADTDVFRLPERLLTLDLIWRWRSQKRLEYAEDMQNFEMALAKAILDDKGRQTSAVGRQRVPAMIRNAYPGALGS